MQRPSPVVPTRRALGTYLDRVMAPQPLGPVGPMALGLPTTTGTQDVDLILSQALKMNMREVPSYYGSRVNKTTLELQFGFLFLKNPTCQHFNKPVRIHCKAGSVPARFVFETRAKSQDFVDRYKDDGIPFEIDSRFCNAETVISVRQSRSLEDWEIGKQFAPLWRVLAEQLKTLFHDGDDQGAFIVPALDACSQVLSIKDRRKGSGKPLFKLAPSGSAQLFTLVAPDLCVPGITGEVLQRVISQPCTASV